MTSHAGIHSLSTNGENDGRLSLCGWNVASCIGRVSQWSREPFFWQDDGLGPLWAAFLIFFCGTILYWLAAGLLLFAVEKTKQRNRKAQIAKRRYFVTKIHAMLLEKHPEDPEKRLLPIAKSLEYRLHKRAKTEEEYMDESTLKHRLRAIVKEIFDSVENKDD